MSEEQTIDTTEAPRVRRGLRRLVPSGRTRAVLIGTGVLAFGIAPLTYAATGGNVVLGDRNSSSQETEIIGNDAATSSGKGGYSTRQSNLSASGGGAIYGCRATAKTSATDNKNPCIRANNLASGLAFEFSSTKGILGGTIRVAGGGDATKPFTTNATGVATGLNADRVDGKDASAIVDEAVAKAKASLPANAASATRWALVTNTGTIEAQSGGFTVKDAYRTNANVYIDAGQDLSGKGITSTIAIQNAGGASNFGGEVSASRCAIANVVACAPAGTNNANHLVVSPRNSDGTATTAGARKRFYVTVTP